MSNPFQFSDGQLAYNTEDLIKICQQKKDEALNHLMKGDFENWLNYIGDTKTAELAKTLRESNKENSLSQFVDRYQQLSKPELPKAVTTIEKKQEIISSQKSSEVSGNLLQNIVKFFKNIFSGQKLQSSED